MRKTVQKIVEKNKFSISAIVKKHKIKTSGVLHVGANFGQEAEIYDELGFEKIFWVEGYPEFVDKLKDNVGYRKNHQIIPVMISDIDGEELVFSVASNTGSSTLLQPTEEWHKTFSEIKIVDKAKIVCRRLDDVLECQLDKNDLEKIEFLVLDVEGAELKALNSMGVFIKKINYALIEVSLRRNFENGPLLEDIDGFMLKKSFVRVYMKSGAASGDALYKRVGNISKFDLFKMRTSSMLMQLLSQLSVTDFIAVGKKKIKAWVGV